MTFRNKRILITGITGFVGVHLARYLLDNEAEIYGIVRHRADGSSFHSLVSNGIIREANLVEGDVRDIGSIASALNVSKPDIVFHLAAQSYVQQSFLNPIEVMEVNGRGTANLLEAIRMKDQGCTVVFAGSSEEYGLAICSKEQLEKAAAKYGLVFPNPVRIPELPMGEENPLRPMSPYAVSKVYGDYLMRNYYHSYGLKTVVSRAFNHEGAGRGPMFVTSQIAMQTMSLRYGEIGKLTIGNVNAFRDWSHVEDIVRGYCLLAQHGEYGGVYNQGSQSTTSVLSYILLCLEAAGYVVGSVSTLDGKKKIENPTRVDSSPMFGCQFDKTIIDKMMLEGELEYTPEDKGLEVRTDKGKVLVDFDRKRFRPAEVPILLSDTTKISKLGFATTHTIRDIARDQLNYFLDAKKREQFS